MAGLNFSILLPVYNGVEVLGETLRSILSQSFTNYELIVGDDCSSDGTVELVRSFSDPRIKLFVNRHNLGYPGNLEACRQRAAGEILYLMGQDDLLRKGLLQDTHDILAAHTEVGAVTRPFFWFDQDVKKPLRATPQLNPACDELVRITDRFEVVFTVFDTLGQLSGLALRRKFMDRPFHPDIFPCHIYPFASIFKKHPVVFLKDYCVAVRTSSSQTRKVSSIYVQSPLRSWVRMFETVFPEERFADLRRYAVQTFLGTDYLGLIQLRNYARYRYLLREIFLFLRYRHLNLIDPRFWFFALGTMLTPPFLLIPLVDWYKTRLNSRRLNQIKFDY
jgi:glycosyltransferase involved in cell wall biosynthesis